MQEILDDILCNGVTEDELESAKNYLIGMSRFDQESVSFRASSISSLVALAMIWASTSAANNALKM